MAVSLIKERRENSSINLNVFNSLKPSKPILLLFIKLTKKEIFLKSRKIVKEITIHITASFNL